MYFLTQFYGSNSGQLIQIFLKGRDCRKEKLGKYAGLAVGLMALLAGFSIPEEKGEQKKQLHQHQK